MYLKLFSLYEIKSSIDLGELGCFLRLSCGIWEIRHEQKNGLFFLYIYRGSLLHGYFMGRVYSQYVFTNEFFLKASTKTPL